MEFSYKIDFSIYYSQKHVTSHIFYIHATFFYPNAPSVSLLSFFMSEQMYFCEQMFKKFSILKSSKVNKEERKNLHEGFSRIKSQK